MTNTRESGRLPWYRPVAALVFTLAAMGLQWLLWGFFKPFVGALSYPALLVSVWIGGLWGGLASTLAAAVVILFVFMAPELSWVVANPNNLIALVVFVTLGVSFSVTDHLRRRALHRVAEQGKIIAEDKHRKLFEQSPDGIFILDARGAIIDVNDAGCAMLMRGRRQVMGARLSDFMESADADVLQRMQTEFDETDRYRGDHRVVRPDGSLLQCELAATRLVDGRIQATARDVQEARRQQDALMESERKLARAFNSTVEVLARATEARDPYTAGHQKRVSELATMIAARMGMSVGEIEDIRIAGLIHDVGKLVVPVEILTKPGRLSDVEYELVRTHARAGHEMLADVAMPGDVVEIVHQHHERLDGSGYPRGLADDQISPGGRVLMVADLVEAMASHRPYRASQGFPAALAELDRGAGTLYDPQVCAACRAVVEAPGFALSEN